MATRTIAAERLRELLNYDQDTGVFTWRLRTSNRIKVGHEAGCLRKDGYRWIRVDGLLFTAHRLAWLYVHGSWPKQDIDHLNGVRLDNRIVNLRDVSRTENLQNRSLISERSRTGMLGVYFFQRHQKFAACIRASGKTHHLGYFTTKEEAAAAYASAKRRLHRGFIESRG